MSEYIAESTYNSALVYSNPPPEAPYLKPQPQPREPPDPTPQIPATCSDYPYNKLDLPSFDQYINNNVNYINNIDFSNNLIDFEFWQKCILKQQDISHVELNKNSINTIIKTYNIDELNRTITANDSNDFSMQIFQNNIYYTYAKIVLFIILICSYIYFFRISGIIGPIMALFNLVKMKISVNMPKILSTKIPGPKPNEIKTNSIKTNSIKKKNSAI